MQPLVQRDEKEANLRFVSDIWLRVFRLSSTPNVCSATESQNHRSIFSIPTAFSPTSMPSAMAKSFLTRRSSFYGSVAVGGVGERPATVCHNVRLNSTRLCTPDVPYSVGSGALRPASPTCGMKSPVRLIAHQVAHVCGVEEINRAEDVYARLTEECDMGKRTRDQARQQKSSAA